MKRQKKIAAIIGLLCFLWCGARLTAAAEDLPYDSYNYNYFEYFVFTPAAYIPESSVSGVALGCGVFNNPQDICVAPNGCVYVADTGNNRIVILNPTMTAVEGIVDTFEHDGKTDSLASPYGVCVSEKGCLYVADTYNKRIVVFAEDGSFSKIVENPKSEVLEDDFVFTPLKVTVDYADRIYCIAQNMFEGIMVFEADGNFTGFYGTINVEISLWEKFWKKIATKEERTRQELFIPTEFTGIDVDDDGFVYASNLDSTGVQAVRRLNPKGQDVIKKGENENVGGDILLMGAGKYAGPSEINDVVYRGKGMYSLLDRKRGRIFTYDHEGNLLYIFGGLGTQAGTFVTPVAIEETDDRIIVLDSYRQEILVFSESKYGSLINDAVGLRYDGDETLAVDKWKQVLRMDENNELANTGIGKAYLTAGDYKQAMKYLKLGRSREYYSIAYKRYRNQILKDNINYILTGIIILAAAGTFISYRNRKKKGLKKEGGLLNG